MEGDHLALFEIMQGNNRDGIEGWLKDSIPLLLERLESDGYKITILSSSIFLHVFKLILQFLLIVFNISKSIYMFNFVICL